MKKNFLCKMSVSVLLASAMLMTAACGKGGNGGSSDTVHVTYWIPKGEDTSFYEDYNENPISKYVEENYTFNGKKVDVEYFTAPPGAEADDFSTLIGTGDYCDIMDMSMASVTPVELYSDGMIWDLTELIPEHMPNYMAFLEENPDVLKDTYNIVDGEKKWLMLFGFNDEPQVNFEGYVYRRDWIVEYGTNPQTGAAFTGGYTDPDDYLSWEDDVVFPSGGDEPIYISDWEWMFEIFTRALEAEGITDGYCFAPYYWGYQPTGDLYSGFGGGAPTSYIDVETDTIKDGTINDNMRAYLQCMNTWWNNGWLDKSFAEHTGDMFFAVDSAKVFQGKVGLWQGRISTVGAQIDAGDDMTSGIMVYGARQPINDIYGGPEQQNKEPNASYQFSKIGSGVVLTDKMSEEEVITYLQYADFMFSEEGGLLTTSGFNAEQAQKAQDAFYESTGHMDGLYDLEDRDGVETIVYKDNVDTSSSEFNALTLTRVSHRLGWPSRTDIGYDRYLTQATDAWGAYGTEGNLSNGIRNAVSIEDAQQITKINANLEQFLQRTVSAMIKGEGYDVWSDADWEAYVSAVKKYQADTVTEIYNKAYDLLKEE